jgi:hypothetical protein
LRRIRDAFSNHRRTIRWLVLRFGQALPRKIREGKRERPRRPNETD